ncbi:hypothetical protein H5392_02415 [Tessaracoccus sp. MC1865]|uniref:hypothetical protein n=1 Tax=Tessaracoccus sp. MC1865 TaxID=2760310 RepID=UPI00160028E6|nr:hypothetical protein [Tessaracoccus sp. MC1865]MBB1482714.1 hypothetical protein [Tessaracoccus sp. MC1865]QTO37837.1 hypothetical protein J7D54_01675 [Tessaracoccus sp. MC1865]
MTEHFNDRPDDQSQGERFADEPTYTHDATEAAAGQESGAEYGTTGTTDAPDASASDAWGQQHTAVDGPEQHRSPEQLGDNLRKAAEETAYAAVGFVGLVADKAKEFYEEQKKQYVESHPEADSEAGAKNVLAQLREQLDKFMDEINRGFRDLAERGRASGKEQGTHDAADPADENKDYTI